METTVHDVRYAARTLRKSPGFTLAAVLTLAMGIGAATAIFSMVNGVLLHRLPMANGARLVHIRQPSLRTTDEGLSALEVADVRRDARDFSEVAEYHSMTFKLYGHGDPLRVTTGVVSDSYFDMLGVKPALGRTFRPGEEAVGAAPVVILSHAFWMDQFHGDSSIIGATFTMNDRVHTVIGVLPPLPVYPDENDIWMPVGACPFRSSPEMANARDHRMVRGYALLKPGVSADEAAAELTTLTARFHAAYPAAYPEAQRMRFVATDARDEMTRAGPTSSSCCSPRRASCCWSRLRTLPRSRCRASCGAHGSSPSARHSAPAARACSGSWRSRACWLPAAGGGRRRRDRGERMDCCARCRRASTPRAEEITMSGSALLFALALCMLIALLVAAVPFAHSLWRRNVAGELRVGNVGFGGTRRDYRIRDVLVAVQVALAFVMLVGAGLIGRSLVALERVDAGVDVRDVLTAQLEPSFSKYDTPQKQVGLARALLDHLDGLPGVRSIGLASTSPLRTSGDNDFAFTIVGDP